MVTSLQNGLLSGATAVFAWATNVYNCGFLNDFFMVTPNSTIAQRNIDLLQTLMEVIHQNLFLGGRHNLEVYRWLPAELQDGNGYSQQVAILTGVTVLFALLLLLLPLALVTVSCNCPCCCKRDRNVDGKLTKHMAAQRSLPQDKEIHHDPYLLEKLHTQALKSSKSFEKNVDKLLICHVAVFVFTFVLLLVLMVMICILFDTGHLVIDMLAENRSTSTPATFNPDNFNLLGGLNYVFAQTLDFLISGTASGNASTANFLVRVNSTFMTLLEGRVAVAVDSLLEKYGVQQLVQTGNHLQSALNVVKANMESIRLNNQKVSSDISNLVGQFKVHHDLIVADLKNACTINLGVEIAALCTSLQNRTSILLLQFNASAIKVDPPAVLNFVFTQLGIDLSAILDQFSQFTSKILEVKDQILAKVATLLDLHSFFSSLIQVWNAVANETTALNVTFTKLTGQVEQGIGTVRPYIYAMVYIPITIFLGILLAYLIIAVLYVLEAKNTKLFYMDGNVAITSSHVCSNRCSLIHAVLFTVFLTVASIFIIIALPTCVLLVSDGCAYLTDQRGVGQSDYVLNSFVASELWLSVVRQVQTLMRGSVNGFLVLPPPTNIINATTVLCGRETRSAQMGLLGAVGWRSLINISALLSTKEVTDKINNGENTIKNEIIKLNLASLIPKDLDKIVITAQNLTQYFDNINYQSSIDELSPSRLPQQNLTSFADDLEDLVRKIRRLGLSVGQVLERVVGQIRLSLKELIAVKAKVKLLRDAFIAVQTRRNLTVGVTYLVGGINATKVIFNNNTALLAPVSQVYWQLVNAFKVDLNVNLTSVIETFVQGLFPCSQLYAASDALLTMVCRQNGGVARLFTWFYTLAIAVIITTLLCFNVYYLGFVQSHHFRRLHYKQYQPHTSPSQNRYVSMPSGRYAAPQTTQSSSSPYYQIPPGQAQQQQNFRLTAPIPAIYEYTDRRGFDLGDFKFAELSGLSGSIPESDDNSEHEASSYQPVPLPRSGRRYSQSKFYEEQKEQEGEQEQEQERHEEEGIEAKQDEEKLKADTKEEESQHQISDHDI
ncbi:hypothetical protein ECG_09700 [Echinococcus granulosus]|uniref:Prominin-1-A-like n=1 Tax=Echinococcus granulosus TaxID=6210 RepID=A0A068WKY1_ECHGR|nr:hypothetical protein ECG_09700 [Echinococcus granulosus]CDS20445.1 hypothetical protein EgrG_001110400 [Echinococcus granulosus]